MEIQEYQDVEQWSQQQWGQCDFGHARRTARAVRLGASLAARPEASLPRQIERWGDLKAAYTLLSHPSVSHTSVSQPHWQQTINHAAQTTEVVLFVQDTTQADYSSHSATSGLGRIGDGRGSGILIHTCLAIQPVPPPPSGTRPSTAATAKATAKATVHGVAHQRLWSRQQPVPAQETRTERRKRWCESHVWEETLEAIGPAPAGGKRWVSVGDRASDVFSYVTTAERLGWDFLLRVCQDRRIETTTGTEKHLITHARSLPASAQKSHGLRSRNGQPQQSIELEIATDAVWIEPPPSQAQKGATAIRGWVIRCWGRSADGTAIEWLLLTSIAITDRSTLLEVISWYEHRWLIEEYHKCLKSGCSIEQRQLRQSGSLEAFIGFASIVAVRLLVLRTLSREQPEELAVGHVDRLLIELVRRYLSLKVSIDAMTVREFWHGTARMGGFIGRKSDGDAGWQTLWRGWHQLQQMAWAARQPIQAPP